MQIHIKAEKIQALRPQKFCWRIIGERAETIQVHPLGLCHQFIYELRHRPCAAPAHNVRRNLVCHAVGKHRRVPRARTHRFAHRLPRPGLQPGRVQKTKMFVPRDVNQHLDPLFLRQIKKPARGYMIYPHQVGAEFPDLSQILRRLFARCIRSPSGIRREWAVGDALQAKFPFA